MQVIRPQELHIHLVFKVETSQALGSITWLGADDLKPLGCMDGCLERLPWIGRLGLADVPFQGILSSPLVAWMDAWRGCLGSEDWA